MLAVSALLILGITLIKYYWTAAIFLAAANAQATDIPQYIPPAPAPPTYEQSPSFNWSGPYIGALVGIGQTRGQFQSCGCESFDGNFNGRRFGGFVGYNWQSRQNYVVGLEGDLTYDANGKAFADADKVGTGLSGSARIRVGYAIDNVLLFAAAGWTATKARVEGPDDHATAQGWTLGAGVDWAAGSNVFVRAEYRYNAFDRVDLAGVNSQFDQNVVNFGIGYKF